jgi:hypothetical protein
MASPLRILSVGSRPTDERVIAKGYRSRTAPYAHPKLASVESRTGGQTHEDRLEEYRRLLSDD